MTEIKKFPYQHKDFPPVEITVQTAPLTLEGIKNETRSYYVIVSNMFVTITASDKLNLDDEPLMKVILEAVGENFDEVIEEMARGEAR